jgi:hypothetical protein
LIDFHVFSFSSNPENRQKQADISIWIIAHLFRTFYSSQEAAFTALFGFTSRLFMAARIAFVSPCVRIVPSSDSSF